jgi:hypothetical protein
MQKQKFPTLRQTFTKSSFHLERQDMGSGCGRETFGAEVLPVLVLHRPHRRMGKTHVFSSVRRLLGQDVFFLRCEKAQNLFLWHEKAKLLQHRRATKCRKCTRRNNKQHQTTTNNDTQQHTTTTHNNNNNNNNNTSSPRCSFGTHNCKIAH